MEELEKKLREAEQLVAQLQGLLKEAVELISYTGKMHEEFLRRACSKIHWLPGEKPPYLQEAGRYSKTIIESTKSKVGLNGTPRPRTPKPFQGTTPKPLCKPEEE